MSHALSAELLTPAEVAARYKGAISERTLANWRSQHIGPDYIKVGSRVLYTAEAVAIWERSRAIKAAA